MSWWLCFVQAYSTELYAVRQSELPMGISNKPLTARVKLLLLVGNSVKLHLTAFKLHVMAFWIEVLMAVLGFVQVSSTELYAVRQSELQMGIEQKGGGKR